MIDIKIHDNVIPLEFREKVWDYINNQKWYATWRPVAPYMTEHTPSLGNFMRASHKIMSLRLPTMWMHRACFGSDEHSLKENHPLIWELWNKINAHAGNIYEITGTPEDMSAYPLDHENWQPPATVDPNLSQGWRVYSGGQLDESIKRSHGVHRDTIKIDDDSTRTILYVANLEWYPSWFAECIFYPEDPKGETGDYQQFQKGSYSQARDFNIGWLDEGKIVSPKPGRIMDYDGRTLHTTRPTAVWAKEIRKVIAFRVRRIK